MKETKLFELVTGTEMKPWLSRNMFPNINTCENGWSNFSANLRVVSLKVLELTQFAWQNLSIYFNFLSAVPRDDVIESTRFLMRPPVIIPPCTDHGIVASSENPPLLSQTVPIRYLHVSKPSQYSLKHATRQLPFYSSSSTHLFIPKTIYNSST